MKQYFSIGEAAQAARTTSETLRHYDRIWLVRPSRKDEWTGYRYYTGQDIVRLNTVRALQQMDLPLQKIKEVLEYDDLHRIIGFLAQAEKKADEKIARLQYGKEKIRLARATYENQLRGQRQASGAETQYFPRRTILLSDTLETPTLDNLWNYLSHFYGMIPQDRREQFSFEDAAGIYTENGRSRMFAICSRHTDIEGLKVLPAGEYLCVDCGEADRHSRLDELLRAARDRCGGEPGFAVQQIVVSGILQWSYQLQVYLGGGAQE